jgi:DNA-binding NarL/FixJ family response regulator
MAVNTSLRILVVEDFPVIREALVGWLGRQPGCVVEGQAATTAETRAVMKTMKPDVVLLDLMLEGAEGTSFVRELREAHPSVPLLVFSIHDERVYAERVIRAGASGYVMKREPAEELLTALRTVASGELYVSKRLSGVLLRRLMQPAGASAGGAADGLRVLTDRELHVFQLIGAGESLRRIAERLGLSLKTVEAHRENIKNKLGLHSASEVLQRATLWVSQSGR